MPGFLYQITCEGERARQQRDRKRERVSERQSVAGNER